MKHIIFTCVNSTHFGKPVVPLEHRITATELRGFTLTQRNELISTFFFKSFVYCMKPLTWVPSSKTTSSFMKLRLFCTSFNFSAVKGEQNTILGLEMQSTCFSSPKSKKKLTSITIFEALLTKQINIHTSGIERV